MMSVMATLLHVNPDTDPAEVSRLVREHGAVIFDDAVPLELLDQFSEEIAPHVEANGYGADDFQRILDTIGARLD